MQFGFSAPLAGAMSAPDTLARLAVEGEAMGYHYMTFSDHVVIPNDIQAKYPYSETGEFPRGSRGGRHEQLISVAYIAGKTSKLKLVLSVMVVPHRPPVLAAKMLSTIDVLSGGRLIVGIGAGWMREEFEALGVPDFADRGAVTDEYIDAFRELWTGENPKFAGKHVKFADVVFEPKPVQKPHPPIWVGGESGPALRRTARVGDAWYPIGTNPQNPLDSLARFTANVARLRKMTQDAGRDPARLELAFSAGRYGSEVPAKASDGERRLFSGGAQEIIGDLRALRSLGVGYANFAFPTTDADAALGEMKRFHNEVLARL
jgi:probable F420-dependent oxidoreductase